MPFSDDPSAPRRLLEQSVRFRIRIMLLIFFGSLAGATIVGASYKWSAKGFVGAAIMVAAGNMPQGAISLKGLSAFRKMAKVSPPSVADLNRKMLNADNAFVAAWAATTIFLMAVALTSN